MAINDRNSFTLAYALGGPVEALGQPDDPQTGAMNNMLATINELMVYGRQKNGLGEKTAEFGKRQPQQALPVKQITPPGTIKGPDVDWENPGGPQTVPPIRKTADATGTMQRPNDPKAMRDPGAMQHVTPKGIDPEGADTGYPTIVSPNQLPSWKDDPKYKGNNEVVQAALPEDDETQQLAEGGPVEEEAVPEEPETTGAIPTTPERQPTSMEEQGVLPHQLVQKGGSMILRWLQGAAAAPTPVVQRLEQEVDPERTMPEDVRKMSAINAALERGGKDTALGVLQNYRQQYDMQRNFAAVKLNSGDIAAAAAAATKASPNMPDGTVLQFAPDRDGVTVAVSKVAPIPGEQPQQLHLSAAQFNEYLRGNAGQYDHLFANGSLKTLQQLSRSAGQPVEQRQAPAQAPAAGAEELPASATPAQGTVQKPLRAWAGGPEVKDETEQKAWQLFPSVNQAQEREEWTNKRQQQIHTNEIEGIKARNPMGVATTRAGAQVESARLRAQAWTDRNGTAVEINKAKMATALAVAASRAATEQQKAAMATVRAEIIAGPDMAMTPDALLAAAKRHGVDPASLANIYGVLGVTPPGPQGPQAPAPRAPQAPTPAAPGPQAPAPAPARDPRYYYDAAGNKIGRKQ